MADRMQELQRAPTGSAKKHQKIDIVDEGDESSSDESAVDHDEDEIKARFKEDVEDALKVGARVSENEAEKNQYWNFVYARESAWKQTTANEQNFLHYLANYDVKPKGKSRVDLQWLMARAICQLPSLMGAMDELNRTPLASAIITGNHQFIRAASKNQQPENRERIRTALLSECEDRFHDPIATSLHIAMASKNLKTGETRLDYIRSICSIVPQAMFTMKDNTHRTPLHVAVEYANCRKGQADIVKEILTWGPDALTMSIPNGTKSLSVYQYHELHRRKAAIGKKPKSKDKDKDMDKKSGQKLAKDESVDKRQSHDPRGPDSRVEKTSMPPPPHPRERERVEAAVPPLRRKTSGQVSVAGRGHNEGPSLSVNTDLRADPSRNLPSATNPTHAVISKEKKKAEDEKRKKEEQEQAADEIADHLKLLFLRVQKPEAASQSLHIHDEASKELWFDFGYPRNTTEKAFKNRFDHLQFDTVLQYVAFPRVRLSDETPDTRYQGREDMVFFFNWLKKKKKVRQIVKAIVDEFKAGKDDDKPYSHSDKAIEDSLESLNVEILDWRRLDLDPLTLSRVGDSLREIYLYWSGRNAVLRSWSEAEGLVLLPKLETIHVNQMEGLESEARTLENLEAFKQRLLSQWPKDRKAPIIDVPNPTGGRLRAPLKPVETPKRREPAVDAHRWMECMKEFSHWFQNISAIRNPQLSDQDPGPVRVAIIDDGTDITHSDLKGVEFGGRSFHSYKEGSTWRVAPYWDSSTGHGTLMARLIRRMCPSAIIHVIKLQTFSSGTGDKLQINTDSAVQAIEHAVEQNVQIISMSWTVKPPSDPDKLKLFDDAVHKALSTNILMFCAASDQGKAADMTYPHSSNPNSFRIGAASSTGNLLDTVGDANELKFTFPGHNVVVGETYQDVSDTRFPEFEAHSGSSVATALAAGLAALIIECVRLGVMYTNETRQFDRSVAIRRDDLTNIQKRENMMRAFKEVGTDANTDHKYVEVVGTFDKAAQNLKRDRGDPLSELEIIAGLARAFLKKGI